MLEPQQRHGMLVFDEIFLRECISVNSQTLTYSGMEDFGGEVIGSGLKANHSLVFIFQSLAANFVQPIAVFTSRGPVKGIVLAQLVIKAICLLENAGASVHGVVSDGASTNRKLWSELGISGKRENFANSIKHPLDDKKKIYMFSDAPHLIKNVRNRLLSKNSLRESSDVPYIRWSHYVEVYNNDIDRKSNAPTRVCPKITQRHIAPDNFSKMNVKLATLIFSNSMAKGIEFYRDYANIDTLKNSKQTQLFTERINNLFDVLNRKYPKEGIKKNSSDFKAKKELLYFGHPTILPQLKIILWHVFGNIFGTLQTRSNTTILTTYIIYITNISLINMKQNMLFKNLQPITS